MLANIYIPREADVEKLLSALTSAHCAALIGLSNMGKSTLLRNIGDESIAKRYEAQTGRRVNLVYADCNRMLDLTDQGFYELILRAINESVRDFPQDLQAVMEACYSNVIHPNSSFDVPLNFNNALTALLEQGGRDLVLLLDEFDEAFATLDGRVFLNLRALRDKYRPSLAYVTANVRHLGTFRTTSDTSEFVELSAAHTLTLTPLDEAATRQAILVVAEATGEILTEGELALLVAESGGHPGLITALTSVVLRQPQAVRQGKLEDLRNVLDQDMVAVSECVKLWRQLLHDEQATCLQLVDTTTTSEHALRPLRDWGLVAEANNTFFSDFFDRFVRRQTLQFEDIPGGLVVDPDAGDVWVDGRHVPPLTDLEFKLLLLLYERLGKVTDKYQIVEMVWGTDYIDTVDDSRIEKLVSRLRAKIEPDPANPHFLGTVRGRGYKLVTE